MSNVRMKVKNKIAYVTVNRPEVLNCFDYATLTELLEIVESVNSNSDIRAVIFTGAGEKAFSAGADLKERKSLNEMEVRRNVNAIRDVFNRIAGLSMPTIAAVNGFALGGGFEWLLSCDFAIAAEGATLGLTETSWAIIPGAGGTQRLPRLIGERKAKELIFTARKISAEEARELGIIQGIVPRERLIDACQEFALEMMKNGPIAIKQAKYAITEGMNTNLETGLQIEAKAYEITIPTNDRIEALQAFNERRIPQFSGK